MPPSASPPLLELHNITYTYGPLEALSGISLQVNPGDLVVLAGRNGSGKSTLLRIAAGWTRASGGSVRILDWPVERHERKIREYVVLVPDAPSFWDELTAWEHLQFVAGVNRLREWEGRARSLLDQLGLRARLDASPSGYSRGMRYKLGLAMALLLEPKLLLLDEPFGPLDGDAADQLWRMLRAHADAGGGVLLSCHQLPAGVQPDRYAVLEEGRVSFMGTPTALRAQLKLECISPERLVDASGRRARELKPESEPAADA